MASANTLSGSTTVCTKLDLSDSASYLPSNLFQPRSSFFNRKSSTPGVQQLLMRRNQLNSLQIYAKALIQLKEHLTELSLRENNFSQFPIEILALKNLTTLSLANNQLEVINKDVLSQLPNLQWLNLAHNRLTQLPVDIVCCHYLRGLDLENNNFSTFPNVIFYLTRLEILMFHKNKIKVIPPNYSFPSSMLTLNLAFNALTQVPSTLINQPPESLTHLHLSGNKLGQLPLKFFSCGYTKLVSLDLHTCHLTRIPNKLFERLSKCKDLRRLNLAINRLTHIPPEIGLLSQLQWLNLNDNRITHLPDTIAALTHLVKLGLVQNQLKVLPPFMFLHMLELQKLDIRRNQLKYMPPSILALAPRQEVDIHVDLAVPHSVFNTLSNPPCHNSDHNSVDCHPYGGSLRTLLFYENATIEHVDGILCELDDIDDGDDDMEQVQVISLTSAYSIMRSTQSDLKRALRDVVHSKKNILCCSDAKFRRSDHPTPNLLSEIDDEENAVINDEDYQNEEQEAIQKETQRILTQVATLREICLRNHLTNSQTYFKTDRRLDQDAEKAYGFIDGALHTSIVPNFINQYTQEQARQCDYCQTWYTQSAYQIGYLTRLCNNRLQIPVRFSICSVECALDAVIKLHQTTIDWHTRQSLAHIDATLLLPSVNQASAPALTPQSSTATINTATNRSVRASSSVITNYWNIGLAYNNARRTSTQTNGTLGTIQHDEDVSNGDERDSPIIQRSRSASSSSSTTATTTTTSDSINSDIHSIFGQSSLARVIRNRVTQFASHLFTGSSNNQAGIYIVDQNRRRSSNNSSSSSSSSSNNSNSIINHDNNSSPQQPTTTSPLLPLVFPNLSLGVTSAASVSRDFIEREPPSIMSITTRLVEGRLQTERSQPQLRLSTPTPNPTAFNHLPKDAIRLEKF